MDDLALYKSIIHILILILRDNVYFDHAGYAVVEVVHIFGPYIISMAAASPGWDCLCLLPWKRRAFRGQIGSVSNNTGLMYIAAHVWVVRPICEVSDIQRICSYATRTQEACYSITHVSALVAWSEQGGYNTHPW